MKYFYLLIALLLIILTGCNAEETTTNQTNETKVEDSASSTESSEAIPAPIPTNHASSAPASSLSKESNPLITIEMENGKKIRAELFPEIAPNTVNNFISLINKGSYNGTIFHRVIPGFMIQGGDPDGTGMGGPGYSIKGEFSANGIENQLKHTRGVLSMARSMDNDSGGSQFFIMVADATHLDGQYAAFGQVIEGMEAVDEIVNLPRDGMDRPEQPPVMKAVQVDTKGIAYPEPEKVQP